MIIQRMNLWSSNNPVSPQTLNREIDNIINTLNNLNDGIFKFANVNVATSLVVTTPNGLHTYQIGVDNDGALTSTQVT